jgi:hypothetical protein
LGGTRLTRHINAGTPAKVRAALLCIALRLLVGLLFGSGRGPTATDVIRLAKALADQAKNHDNAKARERNTAFHVITTLYKALESPRASRTGDPAVLLRCGKGG